ncbi:MAG: SulP family inorganic anion transporter [Caldilineaceae bacterium]|nr:SulP family inorganic anion transporter [Caldilineaceae bacterium]
MNALRVERKSIVRDILAGLIAAVAAIPDGLASGVLAGVNPVYGLYNLMTGTPVGALLTSSVYMAVINTSAMALVVFEAMKGYSETEQAQALVTLTLLTGIFQLALGLLKMGYLTRFISNSVMRGFLTGISIVIILSQLSDFTGYAAQGANKVAQTIDLLRHLDEVDPNTLLVGLLTIGIILLLERTRLKPVSMLVAIMVAALLVKFLNWDSVILVGDTALITRSLPMLTMPSVTQIPDLLQYAIAIGIIGLVQAAGVSQGFPNPDGKTPNADGDFRGQGLANIVAGFFRGLPLGGSVSGTSLVVSAGAQTRWANIFTGLFVAVGVLLFANLIMALPMTSLAAILILAGYGSIKPALVRSTWKTNHQAQFVMLLTLIATLFLPVYQAIFLGVVIQVFVYIYQAAERMRIVELVPTADGDFQERATEPKLADGAVTMLLPYGSLFFAAARDFEEEAPQADSSKRAAVLVVLRGRENLGSTAVGVIERYAKTLAQNGGQLFLVDVGQPVRDQLEKTGVIATIGAENVLAPQDGLTKSLRDAFGRASEWLATAPPAPADELQSLNSETTEPLEPSG